MKKIKGIQRDIGPPEIYPSGQAKLGLLGWGSTYGVIKEAVQQLKEQGVNANQLPVKWLIPLNGDAIVDEQDRDRWLLDAAVANGYTSAYLPGDANLDGSVDAQDLMMIGLNWQAQVRSWGDGDFNLDLAVDREDLNMLALNWQKSLSRANPVPVAFLAA